MVAHWATQSIDTGRVELPPMLVAMAVPVAVVDRPTGRIQAANPAWEGISGPCLGTLLDDVFTGAAEMLAPPLTTARRAVPAAGARTSWDLDLAPHPQLPGSIIVTARDATHEAALAARVAEYERSPDQAAQSGEARPHAETQAALLHARKLETMGQLTAGVAHDFNNILAAIIGSYGLIRRRTQDTELLRIVARGERATERAEKLVQQRVASARRADPAPTTLQLPHVLQEWEDLLCHAAGKTTRCVLAECPEELWPVRADAHQLGVALLNLAVNGRDAMPAGGQLTIAARNLPERDIPADLPPGQYVAVAVHDTGVGMSPDILARAGEAFFTTKPRGKGTGLGLAMVHGFATQSGGGLRIRSTQGLGTTAEIILPRAPGPVSQPDRATTPRTAGNQFVGA